MPNGPIPERFHMILERTTVGHLATIGHDGRPQVNPVWFLWNGQNVLLSVKAETVKCRNLRRNPHVAITFTDPTDSRHYIEIRGEVIDFELYRDLTFVNRLARIYTGRDMPASADSKDRYKLTVQVDGWTGQ